MSPAGLSDYIIACVEHGISKTTVFTQSHDNSVGKNVFTI